MIKIGSSMPKWLKFVVALGVLVFCVSQIFYNFTHFNKCFGWVAVGFGVLNFGYMVYLVIKMILDKSLK